MLANGLRVPGRAGAHEAVGIYAEERVPDPTGAVGEFQRLRRRRYKSEYEDSVFGNDEVAEALAHARNIVAAVRASL